METATTPRWSLPSDDAKRVERDLVALPGADGALYTQLYELANAIRRSGDEIASAVEGIAWELDKAKRGPLAAARRQDPVSVLQDVQRLLASDLLDEADKTSVRAELLAKLAPSPRKRSARRKS